MKTRIAAITTKMTRTIVIRIPIRIAISQQPQWLQHAHQKMQGFDAPHHRANTANDFHTSPIVVASFLTTSYQNAQGLPGPTQGAFTVVAAAVIIDPSRLSERRAM